MTKLIKKAVYFTFPGFFSYFPGLYSLKADKKRGRMSGKYLKTYDNPAKPLFFPY